MRFNAAVALGGGAMVASYFLPWIADPIAGAGLVPHDLVTPMLKDLPDNTPLEFYVFLATFALAALAVVFALINAASRPLVFLAGVAPFGLTGWLYYRAQSEVASLGLPFQAPSDFSGLWETFRSLAEIGLWAYAGGALLLLVLSIADPG